MIWLSYICVCIYLLQYNNFGDNTYVFYKIIDFMFNKICKNLNITKNLGKVSMKLTQKHIKSLTLEKP